MTRDTDADLRELLDKQALTELVTRLSRAVDRCDEELLLSCYWEDALDDHGAYKGDPRGFLEHLRKRTMDPTTGPLQHAISNLLFELDGDQAYGEVYVESRAVAPDGTVQRGLARYVDRYERRDGDWRVAHRRVILESARPGFDRSAFLQGARDRSDASYERSPTTRSKRTC
jgi:ketosteroid isomerase-like protein